MMHGVDETVTAMCHTCGEETEWMIVHRFVHYHGVRHCLKCSKCGLVVPELAFSRYQREKKVMIPV